MVLTKLFPCAETTQDVRRIGDARERARGQINQQFIARIKAPERSGGKIGSQHTDMGRKPNGVQQGKTGLRGAAPDCGGSVPRVCVDSGVRAMCRHGFRDLRQIEQYDLRWAIDRGARQVSGAILSGRQIINGRIFADGLDGARTRI
jgi:hypothetical protein